METFLSCGLLCISAIVLFISYLYLNSRGLPHGPWMWPFLGINASSDNKKFILFLKNLERKYGSIFRFRLGTRHVTVVGGLENIQHVLGQDSVQPYHHWSHFITKNHEPQGLSWDTRDLLKVLGQMYHQTAEGFLGEKSILEATILEEVQFLQRELSAEKCRPINMLDIVTDAVYNIVSAVTIGERLEFDRPSCRRFKQCLQDISRRSSLGVPDHGISFFPGKTSNKNQICDSVKYVQDFLEPRLANHKASVVKKEIPDFIDVCLKYNAREGKIINDEGILRGVMNLFISGCEPTVSVAMWIFLLMTRYPELQKKCRHVISMQIRDGGCVSWSERSRLPFILATIQEAHRFADPVPFGYPYEVSSEFEVGDYRVPSCDLLLLNFRSCHMDYTYWKRPAEFRPENFTDSDGQLVQHEAFLPYGLGSRTCKYKSLADQILFSVFTNIISKFDLRAPDENPNPSLTAEEGLIRFPKPYHVMPYPLGDEER
ncbi:cytochrome P450 2J1-like [Crassostrea virginica]